MHIIISGIGGVGGFYGGKLAKYYHGSGEVRISFFARGENEKIIRKKGLKLETTKGTFTATPHHISSNAADLGNADLIICCTKSYDLEANIDQLRTCISPGTVILPLLNGVDSRERIEKLLPGQEVWEGCVYLVSRLTEPGLVRETGGIETFFFGPANGPDTKARNVLELLKAAGLDAHLPENILRTVWEKFLFISTIASLTSYLDKPIGAILENGSHKAMLTGLMTELKAVAEAKSIALGQDIIEASLAKMATLPYSTTSSMHSDFQRKGRTELESLTGFVVRAAKAAGVSSKMYELVYGHLK